MRRVRRPRLERRRVRTIRCCGRGRDAPGEDHVDVTVYVYDTDYDPTDPNFPNNYPDPNYPTRHNRLLAYIEYVYQGGAWITDRKVRYSYYATGHPSNITIWDGGDLSKDLYLVYGTNGTLWLAIWQEWEGEAMPPTEDYITVTDAWEFRYDSGRERYLVRRWEVDEYRVFTPAAEETWTDYLGPQPYVDYAVTVVEPGNPPVIELEEQMRYLAGFGVHAQETVMGGTGGGTGVSPVNGAVRFLHGDLTRSTMMTTSPGSGGGGTGSGGIGVSPVTRYQYKGGWGYESGLITLWGENPDLPPVTLQHVGWRWYQPGIGRFIQRDPIGLRGGLNLYAYVRSGPVGRVDPSGTKGRWDRFKEWIKAVLFGTTVPPQVQAAEAGPDMARICIGAWVQQPGQQGDLDEHFRRAEQAGLMTPRPPPTLPELPPSDPEPPLDIDWSLIVID